jgi:hypothetical protein
MKEFVQLDEVKGKFVQFVNDKRNKQIEDDEVTEFFKIPRMEYGKFIPDILALTHGEVNIDIIEADYKKETKGKVEDSAKVTKESLKGYLNGHAAKKAGIVKGGLNCWKYDPTHDTSTGNANRKTLHDPVALDPERAASTKR